MSPKFIIVLLSLSVLLEPMTLAERRHENAAFTLKIIHFNDIHARFDEVTNRSKPCEHGNQQCIAGVARLVSTIQRLRKKNPNHLVLNAGDVFQGTVWYTLLKWNVSQVFMNMIKADAMTLGNHEFDDQIKGLVPFLKATRDITPTIVSNLNIPNGNSNHIKDLRSLVNQEPLKLTVENQTIGIIGVIYDRTDKIGNTAPIKFHNSIETVRIKAKQLKQEGVNKIIVLSHCGIMEDRKIAEQAGEDIDIIVGGHSHSLLYTGVAPSGHEVVDNYPLLVNSKGGRRVLIVQAFCHGMYVGDIDLHFDESGEINSFNGKPIYQESSIEKDPVVEKRVQKLKKIVMRKSSVNVGKTFIKLDNDCRDKECKLGSAVADAYLWYFKKKPLLAMIHPGNFRTTLDQGQIKVGDLLTALPFSSSANRIKASGSILKKAFEHGAALNGRCAYNMLQVSGFKVTVDFGQPVGRRTSVKVNVEGNTYETLDESKQYDVAVNSYMVRGGDDFNMFENVTVEEWGPVDADVFKHYIKAAKGIQQKTFTDARITVLNHESADEQIRKCK